MPICATVLVRTKAAFCLVYRGGGGCEYRARRRHVRYLGSAEFKKGAATVLYRYRLNKVLEANRRHGSIRGLSDVE
jgi:hypothetical protein